MSDHDETEILTDDQIEDGPATAGERPWRQRLSTSQMAQNFLLGVQDRWSEADLADLDELLDRPESLVEEISEMTGLAPDVIEDELDKLASS